MSVIISKIIPLTDEEADWVKSNLKALPVNDCNDVDPEINKNIVLNPKAASDVIRILCKPLRFLDGNLEHQDDKAMRSQIWHKLHKIFK